MESSPLISSSVHIENRLDLLSLSLLIHRHVA